MKKTIIYMNLRLFDAPANTTTASGMSVEMKTFYDRNLIENAEPELVHDQWAQTRNIPKNGGKTIEFRKYDQLPKAMTPLTEGVTPTGKEMNVTKIEATVKQYGDFIELSDLLILTAIDNNIVEATTLIGSQAGRTLDTISREVLAAGTNVQYAEGQVTSRAALTPEMKLTVKAVKRQFDSSKSRTQRKLTDITTESYIQTAPTILQKMRAGSMRLSTKIQKEFITGRLERLRALDLLKPLKLKSGLRLELQKAHLTLQRLMCMEL